MAARKFLTYQNSIKILISALFIAPLVLRNDYIFPFIVPKVLFFRTLVLILAGVYVLLLLSDFQKYRPKLSWLTMSILIFWLSFAISTFAGVDWYHSFWDNHERMLGLFTITHYVLVYLIASATLKTDGEWKFVFRSVLLLGSLVMLIGLWQRFVDPEAMLNRGADRVSATLGNPIYYSGYGLFLFFLGLIQFYKEWREGKKLWAYSAGAVGFLGFIGIFLGGTRGTILGLIVGIVVLAVYYGFLSGKKNKGSRILKYASLSAVVVLAVLFVFRHTPFVVGIPGIGRLLDTRLTSITEGTRVMAWRIAVDAWKERPVFGWGPNNFYYAFNEHYNPHFLEYGWNETWFDNAHSVIFNTLTVQGALGILAYLFIYAVAIVFLYVGIRREKINQHVGTLSIAFLIAHLVGLVTVFENPTSYLYFFVFLAFVSYSTSGIRLRTSSIEETKKTSEVESSVSWKIPVVAKVLIWSAVISTIYITDISPSRANKATVVAMQKLYAGVADATVYDEPLSYASPHIDDIRNDIARIVFENLPKYAQEGKMSQVGGLFDRSVAELKKNQLLHPLDVRVHFTLSQFYTVGYQLTKNLNILSLGEAELKHSLELSPRRQQFQYALAFNLVDQNKYDEAEKILKDSIENNPKIGEGWWRLAVIYQYSAGTSTAQNLIDEAVKRGAGFDENGKNILKQIGVTIPE